MLSVPPGHIVAPGGVASGLLPKVSGILFNVTMIGTDYNDFGDVVRYHEHSTHRCDTVRTGFIPGHMVRKGFVRAGSMRRQSATPAICGLLARLTASITAVSEVLSVHVININTLIINNIKSRSNMIC